MKRKPFLFLLLFLLLGAMVWSFLTQPGIKDLKGNFKEAVFLRNEQNEGPVIRLYAVTVSGEYWKEMQQYGDYMPHTKYGTTKVFFFNEAGLIPTKLNLLDPQLDPAYWTNCIGRYEKDGMSQVSFTKYPFKK